MVYFLSTKIMLTLQNVFSCWSIWSLNIWKKILWKDLLGIFLLAFIIIDQIKLSIPFWSIYGIKHDCYSDIFHFLECNLNAVVLLFEGKKTLLLLCYIFLLMFNFITQETHTDTTFTSRVFFLFSWFFPNYQSIYYRYKSSIL